MAAPARLRDVRRARSGESFCVFERGGRAFAVPVAATREILGATVPAPVRGVPPHVAGLVEVRGERVPLLLPDAWLRVSPPTARTVNQVLVVQAGDTRVAMAVDRVRHIARFDTELLKPYDGAEGATPFLTRLIDSESGRIPVLGVDLVVQETRALRSALPGWGTVVQEEETAKRKERGRDHCFFSRGEYELALPVSAAREMLTGENVTRVPQAPPHLVGVINLRGEVLPLLQIDGWLDLPAQPYSPTDQIVVVGANDVLVGLVVDRVRDVHPIDEREIRPYSMVGKARRPFRGRWLADIREVLVLDAEAVVDEAVRLSAEGFRRTLSVPEAGAVSPAMSL
jgi:purine-binding chemotaxis protein CheW